MALIGLLTLSRPRVDKPDEPRAALRIAGLSLLERNLAMLKRAGVQRTIVLADLTGPAVEQSLSALGRQGLDVVANAADIAVVTTDEDHVLLIEEGVLVDERLVLALARAPALPTLAVWPPPPEGPPQAIRLDAAQSFASVALVSGQSLRSVARGLGDWDLEQTLLRVALNDEQRVLISPHNAIAIDAAIPLLWMSLESAQDQPRAEALLLARRPHQARAWPATLIYDPIAVVLLRWVWRQAVATWLAPALAALIGSAVAVALALQQPVLGTALALVFGLLMRLDRLEMATRPPAGWIGHLVRKVLDWLPITWLAAIATSGWLDQRTFLAAALAGTVLGGHIMMWRTAVAYEALAGQPLGVASRLDGWLMLAAPVRDALSWLLFAAAVVGCWTAGLGVASAYALIGAVVAIERLRRLLVNAREAVSP